MKFSVGFSEFSVETVALALVTDFSEIILDREFEAIDQTHQHNHSHSPVM